MNDLGPGRDGPLATGSAVTADADEVTCRQFVELITDYFDGTLSQVEEHLVMCDWCTTYLEQMETTISALGDLHDPSAPEPPEAVLSVLLARRDRAG